MCFSEIFLHFLSKNNEKWKTENGNIELQVSYLENESSFYIDISGIQDPIIDQNPNFIIKKIKNNYEVYQAPSNLEKNELKSKIEKDINRLKITYLKNNQDQKYVDIIDIYLTIKDKKTLVLETETTNDKP